MKAVVIECPNSSRLERHQDGVKTNLETLPPVAPRARMPEETFETLPAEGARDPPIPPAGTVLVRHFGDRDYRVTVTADGFMLGKHRYRSLSAVAKAITGKQWNGFLFFRLQDQGG